MLQQGLEILPVQCDDGGPQYPLSLILSKPQIEFADDLTLIGCYRLVRSRNTETEIGRGETG